jgi:lipid A oxidase
VVLNSLGAADASGELALGFYGGGAVTARSDVHLIRPDGTDLTFEGVSWRGESFVSPIYYGIRVTYWLGGAPQWGVSVDYTHAKMFAKLEETVRVTGTLGAAGVDGPEPLGDTFSALAYSHGHNLFTANIVHRWRTGAGDGTWRDRFAPYGGGGLGVAMPHVEVTLGDEVTDEYQVTGIALALLGGLEFAVHDRVTLFPEYKLTYADLDGELTGGGSLRVGPWTHHLVLGLAVHL